MQPTFPFEILEVIAFKHPMAFKLIYQTCRRMTQMNVLKMMDESTIGTINECGDVTYILPNRNKHRGYDLPAVIDTDGYQLWYKNGQIHRDNGPAIIDIDNFQIWLHRDNGPAIIYPDCTAEWYQNRAIK